MNTHEFANKLLELPDIPIVVAETMPAESFLTPKINISYLYDEDKMNENGHYGDWSKVAVIYWNEDNS